MLATLDGITGGRVGWNVVTGHAGADFQALGIEQPKHDERYDRGDEYIEICYRLWDAFPHEALVLDKKTGVCVDFDKLRKVDYDGKYYKCHAYPIAPCSKQGRPLIFQAGQSGRGMQFAAMHSDAIYSLQPRVGTMERHMAGIRAAFKQHAPGRVPRVFYGVQPFLGGTEAEARRRHKEIHENVPIDLALNRLSALIGFDLSGHELDKPLEDITTEGGRGIFAALRDSIEGRTATLREAALFYAVSVGMPQVVGTPAQIADWIENTWRVTGCYGFGISSVINPLITEEFIDHVIPILRKRGLVRTAYAGTTFRENLLQQAG
jgi:FMN-dependent oxidoreductase (nitrilotriacetate monooxygenase family)